MSYDVNATHDDLINVVVSMSAQPAEPAEFDTILLVDTKANSTLAGFSGEETVSSGSKFVWLSTYAEAVAANTATAGSVGTAALADILAAMSGTKGVAARGKRLGLLAADIAGGDTYEEAILATFLAHPEPYWVVPVSHTLTAICDIREAVSADAGRERIVVGQTSNAAAYGSSGDWAAACITTGAPGAALSDDDADRTFMIYFAQDVEGAAADTANIASGFDPDTLSFPFEFALPRTSQMTWPSSVTPGTAKAAIRANDVNVPLPASTRSCVLDPGVMLSGRPAYVTVTADWFKARLREALASYKASLQDAGQKLPMSASGQSAILGIIRTIYEIGVRGQHFYSEREAEELDLTFLIRAEPITSTDRTNRELRFTVQLPAVVSARTITIAVTIVQ